MRRLTRLGELGRVGAPDPDAVGGLRIEPPLQRLLVGHADDVEIEVSADFKAASKGTYDDIYWSLWGLSQALEQILNSSSSLTRQGLLSSLPNASLPNGVYPPTRFNGGHFGGTGAYSQKLNCNETEPNGQNQPGQWDTVGGVLNR